MFLQTGGGGKGIRPNQQHQQQPQQQQQPHHHQSHHQSHHQAHHPHAQQQQQQASASGHHGHPSQQTHSHHPPPHQHQHQQAPPQHQQQQLHHQAPPQQLPYYSYQLSQAAQPLPGGQHPQVSGNATHTPSPPTQVSNAPSAGSASNASGTQQGHGSGSAGISNIGRQQPGSAASIQHYSNSSALMQPPTPTSTAYMTTTYLQQFHPPSAAVMAAVAAQYNSNAVAAAAAAAAGNHGSGSGGAQTATSLYQAQQQQQQHHQSLHPALHATHYYQTAGGATPTAPAHMLPHHHPSQHQLRSVLSAHQRGPAGTYLLPPNTIFALPGPMGPPRTSVLTGAHQQSGAAGTALPVAPLLQSAAGRGGVGGPTTYIPSAFCQPPVPMGATSLTTAQPLLASAASLAPPALQTYAHVGGAPIASSSATSLGTTPSGSAGSMNPENVKPRPHAIPIIHPITHENILDPKPQKKSTAVEAKPSVVDVTASAGVGAGEQQKSVSAGSLQLQPKESDKSITVSMSKAPSASASKEKIDQQMQTDAVRHKSSGASSKVAGSHETTHAAATITTKSSLEFSSAAVVEGKYMAATTSTTIVPRPLAANDNPEVSLEGDNGSVDIAEHYDQEDEEEQRLTVVLEETPAGTSTDGDVVSENATTVGSGEDDVESTSQIDAGDGDQEEVQLHMQVNDLDEEETVKQFQNKAQHPVAFSNTVTEEIAAALKAKAAAENEQALKLKQQQQKTTVAQTSKLSTATLPQNTAAAATSGASSSGTSTPTQQKQKKSAKKSVAASSNAVAGTNSKKQCKASKRAKENSKKLLSKQNDNSNRSNSSSGSSNINNNINNNSSGNSVSVSGGKSFALNAVSVCDNNNDTTTAIITTTAATAAKTRNLTDINNANNFSSSASGNLSNLRETPFAVNLRQQQQQQQKQHQQQQQLLLRGANNNNTRSTNSTIRSSLSVAASKCESLAEDALSQSSTETASQQRKHVKTQEIVAQYLQTPNSKAKTSEEQQLQFLNSSSSACEDDEEINARLQLQDAAAMHSAAAGELRFGEFADMTQFETRMTELKPAVAATMTTAATSTASSPITTTTVTSNIKVNTNKSKVEMTEVADTVDCSAVKTLLPPAKSLGKAGGQMHKATTRPKRLTYTLIELKELAKSPDARKPPLVFCQKGDCIAQLFVSHQQHHHAAHNVSPLALHQHLQYHQHMNYSESMEYVTGKRGRGGQAKKQHHEHQSGAAMGGSAGIVGMGGGSSGAGGTSAQRKMDMIHVHLSLREEIKLSECENAWQPETLRSKSSSSPSTAPNDDLELVLKKVRGVLNKLTPDNFDVLRNTMTSLSMNTEEKMQQVMLLIFEKTVREPNFAPTYAKFCKVIFQEIKAEGKPLFSSALILRIQQEFETNVNDANAKRIKLQPLVDKLETCTDPKERIDLQAELEDQEYQFRRRAWGTVRFIGEMYKLQSLTNDRVLMCIESLLKHGCEEKLEYMCKLLTTVGHLLDGIGSDQSSNNARMEKIFRGIREFVQKSRGSGNKVQSKISSRVRFMMQDVLDLRSRNWDQPQSQQRRSTLKQDEKTQSAVGSSNVGSGAVYEENNNRMRYGNHGNTRQTRDSGTFFPQKSKYVQQQHTIDLEKLKFGSCFQSTTQLGNSSAYKWPSMTGATATATATATAVQTQTLAPIVVPSGASASPYASNSSGGFKQNTTSKRDKSPAAYEQLPSGASANASSDAHDDGSEQLSAKECQKVLNHLVEEMLDDSSSSSWQKDALSTWYKSGRKQQVSLLFHLLISYLHLRDVKRPQRKATASIFMTLMRQSSFDKSVFAQAYKEFGEDFPDLLVDVPQGWTYVFDFLGPLLHERLLQFADIWLPQWSEHAAFTERFLKTLVTHFRDEYGATYTRELWTNHFKLDCGQQFMWDAATWGVFVAANSFEFLHDCNCKPPPPQSQRATSEQVERIGFLLNTSGECDLAIDYITTNVQINATFITNLTKFLCCDYATVMTTHNNNTATTTPMSSGQSADVASTQHLNEELFRSKCTPLLRLCIDASEAHELACLDAIVDSMQYFDDAATANTLICSIFDVLYECEVIPKDSFDKWYRGRVSSVREAAKEVASAVDTKQTHASSQSQQLSRELRAYMEKLL